jgi:hypothetical protein
VALKGTLDAFGVEDVLRMLAGSAKTGCLRVEGDGGRATVWLHDGAVTSAATDRVSGSPLDEVLCDLLRYQEGSFAFEPDDDAPDSNGDGNGRRGRSGRSGRDRRDGHEPVPELLVRAGTLLAERRQLEAVVPSFDHRVGLTARLADGDHVTIRAEQWAVLVAVGAGCTVGELATTLGLGELAALRTVHDLVTAGLTTVHPATPRASRNGRADTASSREPRPSRRPARKARDAGNGEEGRLTRYDEHAGEAWDLRGAREERDDVRDSDDRYDRDEREDHQDRYDDEAPKAWPTERGVPWRPPTPGPDPELEHEPEPELEPEPERYWPDPPPLRSRR